MLCNKQPLKFAGKVWKSNMQTQMRVQYMLSQLSKPFEGTVIRQDQLLFGQDTEVCTQVSSHEKRHHKTSPVIESESVAKFDFSRDLASYAYGWQDSKSKQWQAVTDCFPARDMKKPTILGLRTFLSFWQPRVTRHCSSHGLSATILLLEQGWTANLGKFRRNQKAKKANEKMGKLCRELCRELCVCVCQVLWE